MSTISSVNSASPPEDSNQTLARQRGPALLVGLFVLLIVVFLLGVGIGAVPINPNQALAIVLNEFGIDTGVDFEQRQQAVLIVIRLPRVVLGLLVGASLAVSGAAIQGLFRNPLADPGLIGISGGAAFSAAVMIVLGNSVLSGVEAILGGFSIPIAAFLGGVLTTFVIYRIASIGGKTDIATMLLAGIAINALSVAGVGLMTFISDDEQLRDIIFWNLGRLTLATWDNLAIVAPLILLGMIPIAFFARPLNALLLGESEAGHLGVNVERTKQIVIVCVAMTVGAGVALAGAIGFLGLVVPHLLRLAVGPDHRFVLPGSALLGASLLIGADLFARTVAVPAEVPLGIVTALIGGPFFLWLLLRDRSRVN
ncbi:MAG: iron ABC transporter permease [Aggregatilineales bacterium]